MPGIRHAPAHRRGPPDVDNVALGHAAKMRWNPADQWLFSEQIAYPPIIDRDDFEKVQVIPVGRGNRTTHKPHLWVPIIRPCWSGSTPVLVEGTAESVPSADIEVRDLLRIGKRFG